MVYFVNTLMIKEGKHTWTEEGKEITEDIFVCEYGRTPIMYTNLEEAKYFVENNICDWEECGYYNFAEIQAVKEGYYCPDPEEPEQVSHYFYSVDEGWIESSVVKFDFWYTCQIQEKKILRLSEIEGKQEFRSYNGFVDIG